MREISIENATFERLQRHAQPLVDTLDTVLNRALDALEGHPHQRPTIAPVREFDWQMPPNVSHTKISNAVLEGQRVNNPKWNLLLSKVVILAMQRLSDFEAVRKICPVNMVRGSKTDEGYKYLSDVNLSLQSASANNSLRAIIAATRGLGVEIEISFSWRNKEGAAYPGESARLRCRRVE